MRVRHASPSKASVATRSVSAIVVALMCGSAIAHDSKNPHAYNQLKPWFDGLKSGKGPCCSDADGTALSDPDWKSDERGHYHVRIEGSWYEVPENAVLRQPNLYGRTMVWPNISRDVANNILRVDIRCFIVGTLI